MPTAEELIAAVDAGDAAAVARLVEADPDLASARGPDGVCALLHARYRFERETLDALLAADPAMDVFDAAALGHLDRLRARLDEDPDAVRAFAADGFTALHLAAFFGKVEAARALLDAGADVATYGTNAFANQPLHAAAAGRHTRSAGCCWAPAPMSRRPSTAASARSTRRPHGGDVELVELFLSAGADPTATTDEGRTPADLAEAQGHLDLARRLREVASA